MASTSTSNSIADSATITSKYFHIFINHRGPEVKKTLATHLYKRFNSYGLQAFLDEEEMDLGDNIPSHIKAAIQCADVHIAIFSPRYAESCWCVNELLLMLESGKTIIPIFYGVEPSTVRHAVNGKGTYDASLSTLEGKTIIDCHTRLPKPRYDTETINKWRKALSQVADLKGLTMEYVAPEAYKNDDNQHVDRVVERVLEKLPRTTLDVCKYQIGLEEKIKDFQLWLSQQSGEKCRVVGIVGPGGIGKTTLAKDFFNREESNYDRSCFLFDVREKEARSSLESLQSTLAHKLSKSPVEIGSTAEGIEVLRKRVKSCHARGLVILDDVHHLRQLDALVSPLQNALLSGSLILVTSRNIDVLTNFGIDPISIYKLKGLGPEHSQELFCRHAFAQPGPPPEFERVVKKYLNVCRGLPLSLQVIGASLYGNHDLKDWKEKLDKISRIIPEDIQSVLKISYDGLDLEEKQMFLDIACFFQGGEELVYSSIGKDEKSSLKTRVFEDTDTIKRIWDGSGWGGSLGLRKLQNRCLVDVNGKYLRMHDHLRDMGRDLAQKELLGGHRLWQRTENLDSDLPDQSAFQRTISVRGIKCIKPFKTPEGLSKRSRRDKRKRRGSSVQNPAGLGNRSKSITKLELLRTEGDCLTDILERVQSPDSLIWLSCYSFPYASLPCWVPKKKLTVLQLQGVKLTSLWKESEAPPVMLRELSIRAPLSKFPVSIGLLEHLQKIVVDEPLFSKLKLQGWDEPFSVTVPLETLPDEFCHLQCLKYLELRCCSNLQSLPELFGKLRSLQHLSLPGCSELRTLPDSFGNLINLEYLNLESCIKLRTLPDSFGNLINLEYLNLGRCRSLTMSNYTFRNIERLEYLYMTDCKILEVLPPQVIHQRHLKKLSVANTKLKQLPSEVGDLINLEDLEFGGPVLATLPTWLGSLRSLKHLRFHSFGQSKNLPDSIRELTQLKSLEIFGIGEEFLPPCILEMNNLELLALRSGILRELPFKSLGGERETATDSTKDASIGCMRGLETLFLTQMETSEVAFCDGVCPNLSFLLIHFCLSLVQVGTLPYSLRRLELTNCSNLEKIEGLAGLAQLQTLKISWCKVEELSGLGTLKSLETLEIAKCGELTSILELQQLTKLRVLKVSGCAALQTLQGIESLMSLGMLYVKSCPSLQWSEGVLECLRLREEKCLLNLSLQMDDGDDEDGDDEDFYMFYRKHSSTILHQRFSRCSINAEL